MKKTLLVLMLTSAAAVPLYAETPAPSQPLEDAIYKSNAGAVKALASVYQSNNLALTTDAKANLVALARQQVVQQTNVQPTPLFKDWKSWGMFILSCGQGFSCLASIYKTFNPSDEKAPRGLAALKDTNNLFGLTAQGTMCIGGLLLLKDMLKKSEVKENEAALKNATKVLNVLQQFPTTA